LLRSLRHYWQIYGGVGAVLASPYVHISLVLTLICLPFWALDVKASEIVLSAVPNLLGFTVGALAIVLAFSSADLCVTLAEKGEPRSFFMLLTASLTHFLLVQVLALVVASIAKITAIHWLEYASLFFLIYAVLVTFAAGMQLFNTALIYNAKASIPERDEVPTGTDHQQAASVAPDEEL
jgi:hypothetical protein